MRATGLPAHAPPDEDCSRPFEIALDYPRLPELRHAPHLTTFGAYLEWLDANLANGTLA